MSQDGVRAYEFTASPGVLSMAATDYALVYGNSYPGSGANKTIELRNVWEQTNLALAKGRVQRVYIEDRMAAIVNSYVGKIGTLVTDKGTASQKTFTLITLMAVDFSVADQNLLVEYNMTFGYPTENRIARALQFGDDGDGDKVVISAEDFTVEYGLEDKTIFKEVFRAAAVRVPGSVGLKTIAVRGVRQAVTGVSDLAKRQAAEAAISAWTYSNIGRARTLKIDSVSQGTAHLVACSPSGILIDAATYDLEFKQNWVA